MNWAFCFRLLTELLLCLSFNLRFKIFILLKNLIFTYRKTTCWGNIVSFFIISCVVLSRGSSLLSTSSPCSPSKTEWNLLTAAISSSEGRFREPLSFSSIQTDSSSSEVSSLKRPGILLPSLYAIYPAMYILASLVDSVWIASICSASSSSSAGEKLDWIGTGSAS
mgnify:CR=1 FL=1